MRCGVASMIVAAMALAACSGDAAVRSMGAEPLATQPATTDPGSTDPPSTDPSSSPPTSDGNGDDLIPDEVGVGDQLYPELGFPGIDVQHYDIDISYDPSTLMVDGTVTAEIAATSSLDVVLLDSAGPVVDEVTVDGDPVEFATTPTELVVPLASPIDAGDTIEVSVSYSLEARADDSVSFPPLGWYATEGGSYVLNEPDAARTWMPCNDHPSDKATFGFTLTVPAGLTAVANGALVEHRTEGDHEVWVWEQDEQQATYLTQLLTGDYEIVEGTSASGVPLLSVALSADAAWLERYHELTIQQMAFFEQWFGPYPLDRYGLAITDSGGGLAMETQGRSLFSRDDLNGQVEFVQQLLLSHELAHQWFGDAVTPADWSDIWLNESFATYGQWMWFEEAGIAPVQDSADAGLSFRPPGATGSPTPDGLFSFNVYDGGAIVLHALRRTIGDDAFFTLLRRWTGDNDGQSRRSDDFIKLAEEVSGTDLGAFFDTWLYAEVPPTTWP